MDDERGELTMGCNCGANKVPVMQEIRIDGVVVHTAASVPAARVWVAQNAKGKRATVRTAPFKKV